MATDHVSRQMFNEILSLIARLRHKPMSATHSARLLGRRILIRGAASRIGRRTAELFAAEGALLTLLDCDRKRLAEVARETGGVAADADVTQEVSVARAVEQTARRTPR